MTSHCALACHKKNIEQLVHLCIYAPHFPPLARNPIGDEGGRVVVDLGIAIAFGIIVAFDSSKIFAIADSISSDTLILILISLLFDIFTSSVLTI
tara:strand:+ start:1489 stop:1773 length:285 start_codon:yes stop_codon:yes gene_type:complete